MKNPLNGQTDDILQRFSDQLDDVASLEQAGYWMFSENENDSVIVILR